jgi:hypothetical protein
MAEVRDSRWLDWLLIGADVVAVLVGLFLLRNVVSGPIGGDAVSSVSNAPGP